MMIDEILDLKRFADRSVSGLFMEQEEAEDETAAEDEKVDMGVKSAWHDGDDEEMDTGRAEKNLAVGRQQEGIRRIDLEDAIRNGFRQGFRSRDNAPAEWIGEWIKTRRARS